VGYTISFPHARAGTNSFGNYLTSRTREQTGIVMIQRRHPPLNIVLSIESSRCSFSKRKREQNVSYSDQHAEKKMRCSMPLYDPDKLLPSIEIGSYSERDIAFEEDDQCCDVRSTPIFIHEGVLVGFWFTETPHLCKQSSFQISIFI
jgi:hypothetical protein